MKVDLYTKVVLTIIAICLVIMVLKDAATPVLADDIMNVRIVGSTKIVPVNVVQWGGTDTCQEEYEFWQNGMIRSGTGVPVVIKKDK